jgi:hypothetical protein
MSNILRILLHILIVLLILVTLIAAIPLFERGVALKDTYLILSLLTIAGILFWLSTFIGNPKMRYEEWSKKYL